MNVTLQAAFDFLFHRSLLNQAGEAECNLFRACWFSFVIDSYEEIRDLSECCHRSLNIRVYEVCQKLQILCCAWSLGSLEWKAVVRHEIKWLGTDSTEA